MRGATAVVIFTNKYAIKLHQIDGFLEHETIINNTLIGSKINKDNLLLMTRSKYNGKDCLIGRRAQCSASTMVGSYLLAGQIMEDISNALTEMHSVGVCHRDVSLNNILYDGQKFMLCDFGQSSITTNHFADDFESLLTCIKIFLRVDEVKRTHFTSINYWRIYNDCRNKISISAVGGCQL